VKAHHLYAVHYNPYRSTLGGLGWKCWATCYTLAEARAKVEELRRDMDKGTPIEIRKQV
jgi:hypothetical protein